MVVEAGRPQEVACPLRCRRNVRTRWTKQQAKEAAFTPFPPLPHSLTPSLPSRLLQLSDRSLSQASTFESSTEESFFFFFTLKMAD
jgi:hypothetical protein